MMLSSRSIERVRMADEGAIGQLDVGIFGSAIFNIIPTLLQQYRARHPQVRLSLTTLSKTEQIAALRERRLTIGFNRLYPQAADMQVEPVLNEKLILAVHCDHPLAKRSYVKLSSLADEPFILFPNKPRPSLADEVLKLCRESGFTPNVIQETEDVVTSVALVSLGFGLCCVPQSAANLKLPNVCYVPLKSPVPTIDLDCIYRRDDESPILAAFLTIIHHYRKRNRL